MCACVTRISVCASPHPHHSPHPTSMMGFEASTFLSIWVSVEAPPTVAKYLMVYLALTVFPAPLSPLTMMDWLQPSLEERVDERGEYYGGLNIYSSYFNGHTGFKIGSMS